MKETEVIYAAIESLKKVAQVEGYWDSKTQFDCDGILTLIIGDEKIVFNADLKKELRNHHLSLLEERAKAYPPFMIIAERIFPKIKEALRQLNIAYFEASGNIYFHEKRFRYFIETNKPLQTIREKPNRAFTKT